MSIRLELAKSSILQDGSRSVNSRGSHSNSANGLYLKAARVLIGQLGFPWVYTYKVSVTSDRFLKT